MLCRPAQALVLVVTIASMASVLSVRADEPPQSLQYQNGRFEPPNLAVPANTPFKVSVTNHDGAAIEFESFALHRERVVRPGETITVFIPALAPGSYDFFDDFHQETPQGVIVAK